MTPCQRPGPRAGRAAVGVRGRRFDLRDKALKADGTPSDTARAPPHPGARPPVMNTQSLPSLLGAAVSCCLLLPADAFAADGEKTPLNLRAPRATHPTPRPRPPAAGSSARSSAWRS